jgi:hypothetical protein
LPKVACRPGVKESPYCAPASSSIACTYADAPHHAGSSGSAVASESPPGQSAIGSIRR